MDPERSSLFRAFEILTLQGGFNATVVLVGTTLLGIAAGVIGAFVLLRQRSLTADALSHATLPGIGIAFLAATAMGLDGRSLPILLIGASISGVAGVACIQLITTYTRLREDAAIGIVLSTFFGAGVVVLSLVQTSERGAAAGLNGLIYGQAATMVPRDALLLGGIALTAMIAAGLLLKELALVAFNDAFAEVDGWPVQTIDAGLLALVVLVTVAGLQAVGLILVVALLIVPPVAARFWTERLWRMVALSGVMGGLSGYLGATISAVLPSMPAGAVIVLTSGVVFAISFLFAPRRGVIAAAVRRAELRLRIAGDHLLEAAHDIERDGRGDMPPASIDLLAKRRGWSVWLRPLVIWSIQLRGLATTTHGSIRLTDTGRTEGRRISRNHALWTQYLISYADIAPTHVDWSVDQVEHVLAGDLVDELERALESRGVTVPGGATA
ncbi:MAG: iron chelate uptake ABC transporter family permease subunit [Planctomycetota bacterium]